MFLYSYCIRNISEGKEYRSHKLYKTFEDVVAVLIDVVKEYLEDRDLQYKQPEIKVVDDYETIFYEIINTDYDDYKFVIEKWDTPL